MNLSPLSARLKLKQRHLQEWGTLAVIQRKVWILVKEANQESSSHSDNKTDSFNLKRDQFTRSTKMMANQREEREQMKIRHQREVAALEDVIRN